MRRRHTGGVQVIGIRSRSDSQDSCFRSQKTGRGVLVRHKPDGRGQEVNRIGECGQVCDANPPDIGCRGRSRNLRSILCSNFRPAATHLFHLTALSVHCAAASAFFVTHDHIRQAGHNWRGCGEQKKDCNDAGETTHDSLQYTSACPGVCALSVRVDVIPIGN
jgi:hypothetical protein